MNSTCTNCRVGRYSASEIVLPCPAFMSTNAVESATRLAPPTPLLAVCAVSFLASIGTGVVWNGVPFIAKHDYGFTQQQTLGLYVGLGLTYVVGAMSTGRVLR